MLLVLLMDSLLRGVSKFFIGYMGEALVNDVAHSVNGFFVQRGS